MKVWWLAALIWAFSQMAWAHEVRPAVLSLDWTGTHYDARWTQPVDQGRRLKLTPLFPEECETGTATLAVEEGRVVERFSVACALDSGWLRIEGLERTLTDVFVRITGPDGEVRTQLLKSARPVMDLSVPTPPATRAYFGEGIIHILMGWDHLLFVIGLCLLVTRRQILGVATSFTLAHSLTLALSSFGLVSLPSRPVEILIAASIVLLAVEIVRRWRGEEGVTARRPYLVGFGVGLLHGLGFAGALADLGLPKGQELLSLVLFNLGVEAGQFAVIGATLAVGWMGWKMAPKLTRPTATVIVYGIGTVAVYWMVERLWGYWV